MQQYLRKYLHIQIKQTLNNLYEYTNFSGTRPLIVQKTVVFETRTPILQTTQAYILILYDGKVLSVRVFVYNYDEFSRSLLVNTLARKITTQHSSHPQQNKPVSHSFGLCNSCEF